ncbi:24871_t:CDS:2, partial [Cetraspora pellucida]
MALETSNIDVDIDTSDQEVEEEVLKYVDKAYYRYITNILIYIIPSLVDQSIFNTNNSVINIRILGDGYIGNKDKTYKIEKTMDLLKSDSPSPGHLKTPLLPMIRLDWYMPDELHIILRIWNRLWELVIQEIKSENRYDDHIRMIISLEMKRISVTFRYWQNHNTQNWSHTPIIGGNKEKILHDFNFEVIFDKEQATLINCLWRDFYSLYRLMKEPNAVPILFIVK